MLAIALSEARMLVRNKLVAACAIFFPLALGAFFIASGNEGTAISAAITVVLMILMGVYLTATTTLAARRQNLFLKRLRSGAVSDGAIVAGLVAPIVAVSLVQVAIILTVFAFTGDQSPQSVFIVVLGVIIAQVMFAGLALATAGVTDSPEHAQVTTLPVFLVTMGAAFWVIFTGLEELAWVKRALPGGGIAELIVSGWSGAEIDNYLVLVLPSLAWAVAAVLFARAMFRWEPRR